MMIFSCTAKESRMNEEYTLAVYGCGPDDQYFDAGGGSSVYGQGDACHLRRSGDRHHRAPVIFGSASVARYGFKTYNDFVGNDPMSFGRTGDGTAVFSSARGAEAFVDAEKGTMKAADWGSFHNPPLPCEGKAVGLKDTACALSG